VQYLQDKKSNVLEAIQQSLAVIIDKHQGRDMAPDEQPRIVNAGTSTSPTIQTNTTSNCKTSSIPSGRCANIVKGQIDDETSADTSSRYVPRTIRIQPTRFAECLNRTDNTPKIRSEWQEEGTITMGNTSSGKTDKEMELKAKNDRLEKVSKS
jgi:hypothetical protein